MVAAEDIRAQYARQLSAEVGREICGPDGRTSSTSGYVAGTFCALPE